LGRKTAKAVRVQNSRAKESEETSMSANLSIGLHNMQCAILLEEISTV